MSGARSTARRAAMTRPGAPGGGSGAARVVNQVIRGSLAGGADDPALVQVNFIVAASCALRRLALRPVPGPLLVVVTAGAVLLLGEPAHGGLLRYVTGKGTKQNGLLVGRVNENVAAVDGY